MRKDLHQTYSTRNFGVGFVKMTGIIYHNIEGIWPEWRHMYLLIVWGWFIRTDDILWVYKVETKRTRMWRGKKSVWNITLSYFVEQVFGLERYLFHHRPLISIEHHIHLRLIPDIFIFFSFFSLRASFDWAKYIAFLSQTICQTLLNGCFWIATLKNIASSIENLGFFGGVFAT